MARYFYNLHELNQVIEDEEGSEAIDDAAANKLAVMAARDVMVGCVRNGELCVAWFIEIQDVIRRTVAIVKFKDAVEITGL